MSFFALFFRVFAYIKEGTRKIWSKNHEKAWSKAVSRAFLIFLFAAKKQDPQKNMKLESALNESALKWNRFKNTYQGLS